MEMSKSEKWFVNSKLFNLIYQCTLYNSFLNFINKNIEGKILEVGCGIGKTTHFLVEKYNNVSITAIDYDKEQIDIANKNKKSIKIKFMQSDATKLKFKSSYFDYVIETNVLHHVKEYTKAIKEIKRVLKNNGYFYLMDISQYFFTLPIIKLLFPPEANINKNEVIKQLKLNEFKIEKSKGNLIFFIAARKIEGLN